MVLALRVPPLMPEELELLARRLDTSTVLEMSKAVSSEIVIERLLERLMALAVDHAGAVRGLLIAPARTGQRIEAEALAEPSGVRVLVNHAPVSPDHLPESILHHVVHTQQIVNIEDAATPHPYVADPYLTANRSRSVLCLPIVRHGKLAAVLYLENNSTSHAFTPDRVAMLRVLASQAAISLENARLYGEIRRTQLYLDRAQALSQTGSFGWNIDSGEIFWSDEAFKIYGYERSITPTPELVLSRVHPDDVARVAEQVTTVMRIDADWISEFRLVMPDGTIKHAHVAATAVVSDDGKREYVGAVMDVTAAKRAEEQMRRAEQAEALQLANENLERAKEEAEAANRAKDDFLANVSHEIRTPMNAVLGMTELVLETEVTDEQRQWLRTVKSAADNLLVIIDDLLDFSKIEAGKLELHPSEFALRAELDETTRALALRAERKGLVLRTAIASDVPDDLVGDVGRLRQVLLNLIGNAVKFTERGEIAIEVAMRAVDPDEVVLAFSVRDTGIGIPTDKQAVIFQAFTQQDTSTTRTYGGTGLGLTIAVRLVAMMGGEIGVVSEPGRGSTFTFTARFAHATKAASLPALEPAAPRSATSLRVLIAEDNEFNAQLIRQLLYRRGHQPRIARDGEEALALLDQAAYDLLLLDLHMPGLDGFEVIARVRERERGTERHLPVIALTARSRREDRERCFAAGMDDFLPKPIHASSLWTMVDRIAAAVAPAPRLIDSETLLAACDGNAEILGRVIAALRTHLPTELRETHARFDAGDAKGLREKAHRLQGMISTASTVVAMVASELEDEAANNRLETSAALLARLDVMTMTLLTSLENVSIDDLLAARHGGGSP
jgi:PAS domain S-box-containing protein